MSNYVLLEGDCLEQLKELPDNSIDSLVTDPPAGIGFMGKEWDSDKGGSKQWIAWMTSVMKEGFIFIGIEKDPEYFKIAEARLDNVNVKELEEVA